jgi:hypothetical protein
MLSPEIEQPLCRIEKQCAALATAVNSGDPVSLQSASSALRQAAVDFSGLLEAGGDYAHGGPEFGLRLKKVAKTLAIQREGLIRRSVVVERALHAMVPATRESAYAQSNSGSYASAAGQSGAYKRFAA